MELDTLIEQANTLKQEPFDSPMKDVWEEDVSDYLLEKHGARFVEIFKNSLWPSRIASSDSEMQMFHVEGLGKAITFLEGIKNREPSKKAVTEIAEKKIQADKKSIQQRFGSATFNAPVTFGDNSPISQVTSGEFITALIEEVKSQPETPEKDKLLSQLETISTNPTFSSVAGSTIGSILAKLLGS